MITYDRLVEDFKTIGIKNGDSIALGMSLSSIGPIEGGANTFIDALLSVVGKKGTIMIPTFTRSYPIILLKKRKIKPYSKKDSKSVTGYMSEVLRSYSGAIRSMHPTNSFAAIGAKAEFLLKDHDHNSTGYSPYSKLAEIDGKVLIIGLGFNLIGIRHEAQYLAGLFEFVNIDRGALYKDNEEKLKIYVRKDYGGCVTKLHLMKEDLISKINISFGNIGNSDSLLVNANDILPSMIELLQNHPEKYLCSKSTCIWCRLIEKRLDLYKKNEDKKWFQKNTVIRPIIYWLNCIRAIDSDILILLGFYRKKMIRKIFPNLGKLRGKFKSKRKLKKYRST